MDTKTNLRITVSSIKDESMYGTGMPNRHACHFLTKAKISCVQNSLDT